jgi:hypothetical protein
MSNTLSNIVKSDNDNNQKKNYNRDLCLFNLKKKCLFFYQNNFILYDSNLKMFRRFLHIMNAVFKRQPTDFADIHYIFINKLLETMEYQSQWDGDGLIWHALNDLCVYFNEHFPKDEHLCNVCIEIFDTTIKNEIDMILLFDF